MRSGLKTALVAALVAASVGIGVPSAHAAVLHDQLGLAGADGIVSRDMTNNALDSEAADDFVVPAGGWTVTSVDILIYPGGPTVPLTVTFYADAAGTPGAVVASQPGIVPTVVGTTHTATLAPSVVLPAGTYWLSVVAATDDPSWFWRFGTPVAGNQSRWRNPGNGYSNGCTTFQPMGPCVGLSPQDMVFRINGTAGAANVAPVASDDGYATNEDTVLNVPAPGPLANDNPTDGPFFLFQPAPACPAGTVTNGTLSNVNTDGSFTYTPNANFSGVDDFGYVVNDSITTSNCATVTITVVGVNDAPVANDDNAGNVVIDVNPSTTTNVLANDTDADSTLQNTGTVTVTVPPSDGGTAVVNPDKTITYTASGDVIGPVTYTYQVCDNQVPNQCDTAVVTINVTTSQGGCTITGTASGNTLQGGAGNDVICGGAGNDTLQGGGGNDILIGGSGNDILQGGAGNDSMYGNAGMDTLQGGLGTDFANGGADNDTCQQNESQTSCP